MKWVGCETLGLLNRNRFGKVRHFLYSICRYRFLREWKACLLDQIIDIATEGRHLSRYRGFLKVSEDGTEIGRTPLDQIAAVIVHAHGTTWSTSLLTELAERGAPVVLCSSNHHPRSVLLPIEGHHAQGARMRAQWRAKRPFI